jgi:hypothetical protein
VPCVLRPVSPVIFEIEVGDFGGESAVATGQSVIREQREDTKKTKERLIVGEQPKKTRKLQEEERRKNETILT